MSQASVALPVRGCIADIAYDYIHRGNNVFRLVVTGVKEGLKEHLLQAVDAQDMVEWLKCLHGTRDAQVRRAA